MLLDPASVVDELRRRKCEQPFRPFEIQTVDGGSYKIGSRWAYAGNDKVVSVVGQRDESTRVLISRVTVIRDTGAVIDGR